jgi:O-antigen/teichoic acid export membrane protein
LKISYKPYATLAAATAAAQLLVLLVSPIVTRLYDQEQFGAFGLALGIGAFLGSIASGRLELAIPVAQSEISAARRFALGAVIATLFSLFVLLLVAFQIWLGKLSMFAAAPPVALAVPLLCFVLAVFQLSSALLLWHRDYRLFGISKMVQGFSVAFMQIALGIAALGSAGLAIAQASGYALAVFAASKLLYARGAKQLRQHKALLANTLKECWRYPVILAPAALLNQASQQLPLLGIAQLFGLYETGLFAFTYRICAAPLGLVSQSVGQVYASEFRTLLEVPEKLEKHFKAILIRLAIAGTGIVACIVAGLHIADRINLFGEGWSTLGTIALFLVPSMLLDFVATPLSAILTYLGRQRLQLVWDAGRFASVALVFVIAKAAELTFHETLQLYSVTWALGLIAHLWLSYRLIFSMRANPMNQPRRADTDGSHPE